MRNGTRPRPALRALVGLAAAAGLLTLAGCGNTYPEDLHYGRRTDPLVLKTGTKDISQIDPPGDLKEWIGHLEDYGGTIYSPASVNAQQAAELEQALDRLFGTPAHPRVDKIDPEVRDGLRLDPETLEKGSYYFRRQCLHCHGLTGDGRGSAGTWVNPHPRDYRRGIFKFTSSSQEAGVRKARRDDLKRTITQGVEGTAMPAFGAQSRYQFGVLNEEAIDKIVSYVIHLSLRGEVEYTVLSEIADAQGKNNPGKRVDLDDKIPDLAETVLTTLAQRWYDTQDKEIKGEDVPDLSGDALAQSITRGYNLFVQPGEASCISCHMDFGRQNNYKFDDWGTIVRPLDLTLGVYRGGRRPIDLYWRIYGGIGGANMAAFARTPGKPTGLAPAQIWDMVNFIRALPYPGMLPPKVQAEVYSGTHRQVAEEH